MTKRIQLSIITGFLGSGKTTLINTLLPMPQMANSAVLVNEFGQISIDSDLIESRDEDVMQLINGCVCCALNEELAPTLVDFARNRAESGRPLDKVIIETTGLANAGPIIEIVLEDAEVSKVYELDKVVTTVDAVNGETNLNMHAESVEQVAVADRILVTKLDLFRGAERDDVSGRLSDRLNRLNPNAEIHTGDKTEILRGKSAIDAARRVPRARRIAVAASQNGEARHDRHIRSFCLTSEKPKSLAFLERFWRRLSDEVGPNLLRVKGLVCVAERPDAPAVVQGVQRVFDTIRWLDDWPSDDRCTRIVVIGWMLDQSRIEKMFEGAD